MPTTEITAPHDCGICDAPLVFAGEDGVDRWWDCTECDWQHTSKDCCRPAAA